MKKLVLLVVIILSTSLLLTACGKMDEREAFIEATVEASCLVLESGDILDPVVAEQAKDVYKNYGFDADNEAAMMELTDRYKVDVTVNEEISSRLEGCLGDAFAKLEKEAAEADEAAGELEEAVE